MTVTINGTTGIAGVDGSAATPAVQGVDTNTGIFYGTDIVGVSTGGSERMRIDSSGYVFIGTTSIVGGNISGLLTARTTGKAASFYCDYPSPGGSSAVTMGRGNDGSVIEFYRGTGGTAVGTVTVTSSATAYNTSSDYRLKENIQPMQNALNVVAQLNPVTYKWKADGSDGQGFIAHELQAVVPDCVTGEKDAVDADGNPVYQGIDTSFLVATLTKAIQELTARVEQLEAK